MRQLVYRGVAVLSMGAALSLGVGFAASADDMVTAPETCYEKITVVKCDTRGNCWPVATTIREVPCP